MWGPSSVDSADTHDDKYEMKTDFIQIVNGLRAVYPYQDIWPPIQ